MKDRSLRKLLGNEPPPLVWALVLLPSAYRASKLGWRRVEDFHNGAIFAHKEHDLILRCHGVQTTKGGRWWHAVLASEQGWVLEAEIDDAIRFAFPPNAVVLHVYPPSALREERHMSTVHLWWSVDNEAGLPAIHEWDADYLGDPADEPAPVHD